MRSLGPVREVVHAQASTIPEPAPQRPGIVPEPAPLLPSVVFGRRSVVFLLLAPGLVAQNPGRSWTGALVCGLSMCRLSCVATAVRRLMPCCRAMPRLFRLGLCHTLWVASCCLQCKSVRLCSAVPPISRLWLLPLTSTSFPALLHLSSTSLPAYASPRGRILFLG